jgi:hypothetical protein
VHRRDREQRDRKKKNELTHQFHWDILLALPTRPDAAARTCGSDIR